jgi:hypothetical protein
LIVWSDGLASRSVSGGTYSEAPTREIHNQ